MKKILVVQFRTDQSEAHEQKCFCEQFPDVEFEFFNAITGSFSNDLLAGIASVIFGGSGEFYLGQGAGKDTWLPKANTLIDEMLARDVPFLGLCFGCQMLALHQGARIVKDPAMEEIGAVAVTPLPSAEHDPLFANLPSQFPVHVAHKETAVDLPGHLIPLAHSEKVACQAFRVQGKRAWGVLFHAELDKKLMTERFFLYYDNGRKEYAEGGVEEIVGQFRETREAGEVLRRFVVFISQKSLVKKPALSDSRMGL
ncbi:MAG: type 1 glutamine amidotransferase [Patescibacteria group bacterium]